MKYGLIGMPLGHSFSPELHRMIGGYEYLLKPLEAEELDSFFACSDWSGINVTIPYKEAVIRYLDHITPEARKIGAVNTVVRREGKLYGYNTDYKGMMAALRFGGIEIAGKKVAILGSGGTAKTAAAVAEDMGAREIVHVSRNPHGGRIGYDEFETTHTDTEIMINATPVGMFPNGDGCPVDIDRFPVLCGVFDAIYNPLRTVSVSRAMARGIPAVGGLYMLVAQGVYASEIFMNREYPEGTVEKIYSKILNSKESIVLIGMPGCGKSTVGKLLADTLGRKLTDTDVLIVKNEGKTIPEIFDAVGEAGFRDAEGKAIKQAAALPCAVIATGGGAVLRRENTAVLKQNGKIYFIDRPLDRLLPTLDRPLASSKQMIRRRYSERYEIYRSAADVTIDGSGTAKAVAELILRDFQKEQKT